MKTGLIIQGPILSPGYGPYEFDNEGVYKRNWIEYDSRSNVIQILELSCSIFDYVVLTIWKDPVNKSLLGSLDRFANLSILELEEDDFLSKKSTEKNHKYHQIFSSREGAQELLRLGAELIAKCRTDQTLDIRILHAEVVKHERRNSNSLGVPNINLFEADRLSDFYFVGNALTVKNVFTRYLVEPELFEDTHSDYFYKFSKVLFSLSGDGNRKLRFLFSKNNFSIARAWTEVFYPVNSSLFRNFFWRGRKVNHRLNSWIRWFHVFHGRSESGIMVKTLLNYFLLGSVRFIKRPMINVLSRISYRWYRWLAVSRDLKM